MADQSPSRRDLLKIASTAAAAAAGVGASAAARHAEAAEQRARARSRPAREPLTALTAHEADLLDRIAELLVPSDANGPGATEAMAVRYIDRALAGALADQRDAYRMGLEALERLYPTTIADIRPGRSRYVLLLNERGHLIDDGMVCRESDDRFVLTFTSGGAALAEAWVRDWVETWGLDVRIMDRTVSLGAINVTGPLAGDLLRRLGVEEPPKFLQHRHTTVAGVDCHMMRLSFTGEASFELHHPIAHSVQLWRALMHAGRDMNITPHGLQALFALRLEKGHVIVGMDTELDSTPRRIGMDWAVKMDKPDFVGRTSLARVAELPDRRRLFGFTMDGPAPVEGAPIYVGDTIVGHVASSFTSPAAGKAVMLGWQKHTPFADTVTIDGRTATVAQPPFYDPEGARARA